MTRIKASEYSPNSHAVALNPLTKGQVTLLNKGATNDISERVKTLVQTHLGYRGDENFKTTFTKKEVTFSLKNGPATENRTLKLVNGHWMLSQNSTDPAALDPNVEAEVNTLITEILANIAKANRATVSDPAVSTATVDAIEQEVSSADDSEIEPINVKLASLEKQLQSNLTLEQSLKVQQQILDELTGLRSALEKQSLSKSFQRDALEKEIANLRKALEKKEQEFKEFIREGQAQYDSMLLGSRIALEEKNEKARQLQKNIAALEKVVSEKDTALKRASEELESIIKQIEAESKKIEQAAKENAPKQEQVGQKAAAAFREQQSKLLAEKTVLEEQLSTARSNLESTTKELEILRTENKDLNLKLQKAEFTGAVFNATIEGLQELLKETEQLLKVEKAERQNQVEDLQKDLKTKETKLKRTRNAEEKFERLQSKFDAEKKKFQKKQKALQDQYNQLKSQFEIETKLSNFLTKEVIPELQKDLEEKDRKLKAATKTAEENESQLQSEKARYKMVEANHTNVEKMKKIFTQIDQQTTDLTSKLEAATTENYTFTQNIQDLQESLQEKEALNAKLSKEKEYLNLVIQDAEQEKKLETARSDLNNMKQKVQMRELYSKYLEARLKHLEGTDEVGMLTQENSNLRDKSSSAELAVEMKIQEIASLSEQLEQAKQIQATLQNTVKNLQSELAQAADEAKNVSLEATKKEAQLRENLKEYEEIYTETKAELTKAEKNNKELTDQLESASTLNTLALQQIQALEKSLNEKDQKLEAAARNIVQIESLSEQLETATQMQAFLQAKADGYKSDRDDAKQLAKEAMEAYQIAKENEAQINNEFDAYQEEMEAFVEEQKTELAAKQSENDDLQGQFETEKLFKDFALELNKNFQKSVDEKDEQLAIAAENITQIQLQLEQATEMQDTLQAQNTDLDSRLEDSTMTIQELQRSLRKNEGRLKDIEIERDEAQLDRDEAKEDAAIALDKTNAALLEAQRKIKSLEGELIQAQRELRHLNAEMNSEPLKLEAIRKKQYENNRS